MSRSSGIPNTRCIFGNSSGVMRVNFRLDFEVDGREQQQQQQQQQPPPRWPPGCRSSLSVAAAANRSRPKSQYLQCQRSPTNSTHPYSTDATHHPNHTSVLSLLLRSMHESAPDLQILRVPNILTPAFDQMSLLLCLKPQCHNPLSYLECRKGSS